MSSSPLRASRRTSPSVSSWTARMSTSRAATLAVTASASAPPPLTFRVSTRSTGPGGCSPRPVLGRGRRGGNCQATRISAGTASTSASHREDTAATATPATAGTIPTGASAASLGPGFGGCPPAPRAIRNGSDIRVSAAATTQLTGSHHLNPAISATAIGSRRLIIPGKLRKWAGRGPRGAQIFHRPGWPGRTRAPTLPGAGTGSAAGGTAFADDQETGRNRPGRPLGNCSAKRCGNAAAECARSANPEGRVSRARRAGPGTTRWAGTRRRPRRARRPAGPARPAAW